MFYEKRKEPKIIENNRSELKIEINNNFKKPNFCNSIIDFPFTLTVGTCFGDILSASSVVDSKKPFLPTQVVVTTAAVTAKRTDFCACERRASNDCIPRVYV